MKTHDAVKRALDGKGSKKGKPLHSHSVKYTRADNGGLHAQVERHTKEGHHHTEQHVLADADAAAAHMQEHLGDQPAAGEMAPQQAAMPEPDADDAGGATAPMNV